MLLDAVAADTQIHYGIVDDTITLVAYTNVTGNPVPSSVWMFNGTAARGDNATLGQLTISNISTADAGIYTNTLANGNRSIANSV